MRGLPVGLLIASATGTVMPPMWVHFYGVGVSALVATAAAVVLTTVGARESDARTVIVGGGFALMAALLAVHGLSTPGVILGPNGLIAVTGAATLPVGAAVMTLAALPPFVGPQRDLARARRRGGARASRSSRFSVARRARPVGRARRAGAALGCRDRRSSPSASPSTARSPSAR